MQARQCHIFNRVSVLVLQEARGAKPLAPACCRKVACYAC
jgi:hypothetical protein